MLREDSASIIPNRGLSHAGATANGTSRGEITRPGNIDIQRELNHLEELILDSPRLLISRWTLVDEEQFLGQLDLVRLGLPEAFHEAEEIVRHKDEILAQADQYAREIIANAERQAAQIMNEMGILRQAELQAQQLRQKVQQECEAVQRQAVAEIEEMRRQAHKELEEMQQRVLAECEGIQAGADEYADRVLGDMERQLAEMLRVIRNGRQQLQPPSSSSESGRSAQARSAGPSSHTSNTPSRSSPSSRPR